MAPFYTELVFICSQTRLIFIDYSDSGWSERRCSVVQVLWRIKSVLCLIGVIQTPLKAVLIEHQSVLSLSTFVLTKRT